MNGYEDDCYALVDSSPIGFESWDDFNDYCDEIEQTVISDEQYDREHG